MDLSRFRTKRENSECSTVVRRKKRRGIGGEITFPTEVHPKELKKMLMGKLQSGEYTIGEMIVPKKVNRRWWGGRLLNILITAHPCLTAFIILFWLMPDDLFQQREGF